MESAKIDIKELLLATKIKNTNEKIKWVVIGSFLFTLLVSTLAGITLFSRYLDNLMNGKHEAIVVKLQIPDTKIPLSFMYPPPSNWPMPMFEGKVTQPKPDPASTVQKITRKESVSHKDSDKRKPKIKPVYAAHSNPIKADPNPIKKVTEAKRVPVEQTEINVPKKAKPKIVEKLTSDTVPPGYVKIGKDVYFNPETSKYLMKWD